MDSSLLGGLFDGRFACFLGGLLIGGLLIGELFGKACFLAVRWEVCLMGGFLGGGVCLTGGLLGRRLGSFKACLL